MKKIVRVSVLVLIAAFFFAAAAKAAEKADVVRIGVVDIQKVIIESKGGKDVRAQIEGEMGGKRKLLSEKEDSLRKLRSEIDKGGLSDAEKKEKDERFQKEARELKRLRDETEAGLREMDKDIGGKLIGEILEIVKKAGEEGKYAIILEKDSRILYMPNTIDITGKVIEKYDGQKVKK